MKKTAFVLAVIILVLLPFRISAEDSAPEDEIAERAGVNNLPENEYVTEEEMQSRNINIGDKVLAVIKTALTDFYKNGIRFFCLLMAVIILSATFMSLRQASDSPSLKTIYEYSSVLIMSGVVFNGLQGVFRFAADSVDRLCLYMSALLPVTASLYTMGGRIASGVAGSSSLLLFLAVAERFSGIILMPLLRAGFIVSVTGALPGSSDMRSVSNLLKNTLTTLLAFIFTIFGVVMYFQTIISASADSYVFRTVKFASGVFIPVIGNIVGEAARTVTSAVGVVKASVGAVGLVSVTALTLPSIVYTVMYKFFILIGAMVARMVGLDKESALLYDINGFLSVLMSLLVGTSIIFIIAIALFIRIGAEA